MRKNKNIRLFVSSTFTDMSIERGIIQTVVAPNIKQYCLKKGWQFEIVDLRWGISSEAGEHHKTMRICLNELSHCQQVSPKPNFLLLIGQRYGWIPLPELIPEIDASLLLGMATALEKEIFYFWYELNVNAIAHTYELKPESNFNPQKHNLKYSYIFAEKVLKELFNRYNDLIGSETFRVKYCSSATEQEIVGGIFKHGCLQKHVIFYERNLTEIPNDCKSVFLEKEHERDLELLKSKIYEYVLQSNIIRRDVQYSEYLSEEYYSDFALQLSDRLLAIIDEEINDCKYLNSDFEEEMNQQSTLKKVVSYFCGRQAELDKIYGFVDDSIDNELCLIDVPSGYGKTSLLAKFVSENKYADIIYRFIGRSWISSDGRSILKSILKQFNVVFNEDEDYLSLARKCANYLRGEHSRKIIVIDALDQLEASDPFLDFSWLPNPLPGHCKVIVSKIPEVEIEMLHMFSVRPVSFESLSVKDVESSLRGSLLVSGREITMSQMREVLDCFLRSGANPILLKIILQMAVEWKSSDDIKLPHCSVKEVTYAYLDDLCKPENFGGYFVSLVLGLLSFSNKGVTEDEILEMCARDDIYYTHLINSSHHKIGETGNQKRIPYVLWSRFYFAFSFLLTTKKVAGGIVFTYSHNLIRQIVTEYLIERFDNKNHVITLIRLYFVLDLDYQNLRTLEELPFAYIQDGKIKELKSVLCNSLFIQANCANGLIEDLLHNYRKAIELCHELEEDQLVEYLTFVIENRSVLDKYAKYDQNFVQDMLEKHKNNNKLYNNRQQTLRRSLSLLQSNTIASVVNGNYALICSDRGEDFYTCYIYDLVKNKMYRHVDIQPHRYGTTCYSLSRLTLSAISSNGCHAYMYDEGGTLWYWEVVPNVLKSYDIKNIKDIRLYLDNRLFYLTDKGFYELSKAAVLLDVQELYPRCSFNKIYLDEDNRIIYLFSKSSNYIVYYLNNSLYFGRSFDERHDELIILNFCPSDNYVFYREYEEKSPVYYKKLMSSSIEKLYVPDYIFRMYVDENHENMMFFSNDEIQHVNVKSGEVLGKVKNIYTKSILKIDSCSLERAFYTVSCENLIIWNY